jgi:hypothetical protein
VSLRTTSSHLVLGFPHWSFIMKFPIKNLISGILSSPSLTIWLAYLSLLILISSTTFRSLYKSWISIFPSILMDGGSRDSVVGIATRYGLEGPGIESQWDEIFRTYPDRLRGPPSHLYNGYRRKGGQGVMLTTHPLLVPRIRKSWAILPLTLWALLGLLRGSLYPYLWTEEFSQLEDLGSGKKRNFPSAENWTVISPSLS